MSDDLRRTEQIQHPFDLMSEAIAAAQDLVERMEPLTDQETQARERAATLLDKLHGLVQAQRVEEPLPVAGLALAVSLVSHPNPAQARHDHLVVPLLTIGSVTTTSGLRKWLDTWLSDANTAVGAEVVIYRAAQAVRHPTASQ